MTPREMLERLIAFPTVSRDSNLDLIDFVQDYLDGYGVRSQALYNDDDTKANLYATIGPPVEGGVVLSGHTDVVPVDGQDWHSNPFRLSERDGRLYGRGACDMKGFLAIALALVPDMTTLKRPIHLALSYDEEVGCQGAPAMIAQMAQHLPHCEAVIVGEPTMMDVVTAHKGIMALNTTVTGREAHSSQTHRGVSAVMTAARLITFLDDLAQARQAEPPREGFEPGYTTIHVGTVRGGTAVNIISRHCGFMWDVRNVPDDDPREILARFEAYCRDEVEPAMRAVASGVGIDNRIIAHAPALEHRPDSPATRLALELTGQAETHKVPYAAEAGQFQEAGFATVICGPGSIDQAHQPDEFLSLEQLRSGADFIHRLIHRQSQ